MGVRRDDTTLRAALDAVIAQPGTPCAGFCVRTEFPSDDHQSRCDARILCCPGGLRRFAASRRVDGSASADRDGCRADSGSSRRRPTRPRIRTPTIARPWEKDGNCSFDSTAPAVTEDARVEAWARACATSIGSTGTTTHRSSARSPRDARTGMPSWQTRLTPDQTWKLVDLHQVASDSERTPGAADSIEDMLMSRTTLTFAIAAACSRDVCRLRRNRRPVQPKHSRARHPI